MGTASGSLKGRLWAAAIVAGLAAVAALVVVVFKFGRYDPSPPSLVDHPNPAIPGEILFVDKNGCISRAAASGATRSQVYCPGAGGFQVTWVNRDEIAFSRGNAAPTNKFPSSAVWVKLDLATKQTTDTTVPVDFSGPNLVSPRGESVAVESNGDVYLVAGGTRTKIVHFDVHEYRVPAFATWSPDGEWFLLTYWPARGNGQEVWVISRDGGTQGTLLRSPLVMGPPWFSWWIDGVGYSPEVGGLSQPR